MIIKTLYRGFVNDRYDGFGWAITMGLAIVILTTLMGFGTYWGLYFFSPLYGDTLFYCGWMAAFSVPVYWFSKILYYVSQRQRGVFDKKREWKLFKRKPKPEPEVKSLNSNEALDFIQGIRSSR